MMRKLWLAPAVVIAAMACAPRDAAAQTEARSSTGAFAGVGRPGALKDFQPVIAAFGENGSCETIPMEGGRMVLLSFSGGPNGAGRNVALTFDGAGKLRSYSDLRGDVEGNGARSVVTIALDGTGPATAMNLNNGAPTIAIGTPDEAMDLAALGTPRAMIEQVRRQCGTGDK